MNLTTQISEMTLGTVQLGMNYGIANDEGRPDEEKAFRILESAFESGINCLDTAADYGDSETIIGKYLEASKKKRSEINIVTKFKLGKLLRSEVEYAMFKSFERSLKRLNTSYIDILLLHDAKEFTGNQREITKVFERLLSEGILKVAGASCYEFNDIVPMLDINIFQAFQVPVNLLDKRIARSEAAQKLNDRLIFARSIFLQGLFFLSPDKLKGNLTEAGKFIQALENLAKEMNISVAQLAVGYVKSFRFVDSLVIGADNPSQVTENARLAFGAGFDNSTIDKIEAGISGAPDWLLTPFLWDQQVESNNLL